MADSLLSGALVSRGNEGSFFTDIRTDETAVTTMGNVVTIGSSAIAMAVLSRPLAAHTATLCSWPALHAALYNDEFAAEWGDRVTVYDRARPACPDRLLAPIRWDHD